MTGAYLYHLDAASPAVQSGRPHSILLNFQQLGVTVRELFPLVETGVLRRKLLKAGNRLLRRQYLLDRDVHLLRSFGRQAEDRLQRTQADFIFSPSTLPLSYLETAIPVTFCSDAPFCAMRDYYDSFTGLTARQIDLSEELENDVLRRATLAVYPSEWAADQAVSHYAVPREKVEVIPFGANFGQNNRREDVERWIEQRIAAKSLRLLFIGREWERKGGDIVVQTAQWLHRRGVHLRVDLVGCKLPDRYAGLEFLRCHGSLNPNKAGQREQLSALFRDAHFYFGPSRAEAFGMTFCEANAFALPAISTATGGISSIIKPAVNGFVFPVEEGAPAYGQAILEIFECRDRYEEMARASFAEFEERLNWRVFCRTFVERAGVMLSISCPLSFEDGGAR
jgi:glycosyltransferase involved in cell wall biosynthesis